jgi:two-component system sensor histidine kinase SenX3
MVDESQRMARTIEDLLELSRVEMGAEMLSVPVDLGSVARDAIERVRAIAEKDGITLGVDAESDCTVIGDPHQLRSAVRNLVDNAVQYSHPEGHVDVRVRRAGDGIVLEVEDRGIGIPAANIDRIFERFYRIDRARSRVTGGTGIGLSIVRHVAHNHGAAVDVRSYEGEGSIFTMVFPATGTTPATGGTQ